MHDSLVCLILRCNWCDFTYSRYLSNSTSFLIGLVYIQFTLSRSALLRNSWLINSQRVNDLILITSKCEIVAMETKASWIFYVFYAYLANLNNLLMQLWKFLEYVYAECLNFISFIIFFACTHQCSIKKFRPISGFKNFIC